MLIHQKSLRWRGSSVFWVTGCASFLAGLIPSWLFFLWLFGSTSVGQGQVLPPDATQTIDLRPGWNLISVQVGSAPWSVSAFRNALDDPGTAADERERLIEVWGYTASASPSLSGVWTTYQPPSWARPWKDIDETSLRTRSVPARMQAHSCRTAALHRRYSGALSEPVYQLGAEGRA